MVVFNAVNCGVLCALLLASPVACAGPFDRLRKFQPPKSEVSSTPVILPQATFEQYIDHSNPKLGTFQQRYAWNSEHYQGPGSPVILVTQGEQALDPFGLQFSIRNNIWGKTAKEIGGALVFLEHRYWGESSPYSKLTTRTLQHLTLKNSMADHVRFARTVKLPFDVNGSSNAPQAPWVFSGGSYAGSLVAWTEALSPDTFWAYHASSAVVEAIYDFWQYWAPTEKAMSNVCANRVRSVVARVDEVFTNGTPTERRDLKSLFGLEDLTHADDFGYTISNAIMWQYGPDPLFCDSLRQGHENKFDTDVLSSASGNARLRKTLSGYAFYYKKYVLPSECPRTTTRNSIECLNSHNASNFIYTDTSVDNWYNRQWGWMLCNEPFSWWIATEPKPEGNNLVSKFTTAEYFQRMCKLSFPTTTDGLTYGSNKGRTVEDTNAYTKGWNRGPSKRLLWVNGQLDPWRSATVSSDYRPGGPKESTAAEPIKIISHGYHSDDLYEPPRNPSTRRQRSQSAVVDASVKQITQWVLEFPPKYSQ